MTREEKVQYWLDIVADDIDLAEFLFRKIVEQTKQMQQWILQECLVVMRFSTSSDDTSK